MYSPTSHLDSTPLKHRGRARCCRSGRRIRARRIRRKRTDITLCMRRRGLPIRLIIRTHHLRPAGDVELVDGAVEDLQRRDRLVKGDLVAGLVDAREGEVAVLARLAVLDAVDHHGRVAGGREVGGVRVVGGEGDSLTAELEQKVVSLIRKSGR